MVAELPADVESLFVTSLNLPQLAFGLEHDPQVVKVVGEVLRVAELAADLKALGLELARERRIILLDGDVAQMSQRLCDARLVPRRLVPAEDAIAAELRRLVLAAPQADVCRDFGEARRLRLGQLHLGGHDLASHQLQVRAPLRCT